MITSTEPSDSSRKLRVEKQRMRSKQNKAVLLAFVSGSVFGAALVIAMYIQI
ncbi:hypothetical protein VCHENC02_1361 [Vibrio harveyi]|uniref:Uncharacterized protein n=1 Tax=Vibrio harveyi TaxID=669 RepID=A0A454D3D8_VIBHA|nr:hypothetical protein VCHENC02_1361 [Vibrio harveyi]